jgi:8-oxo-dGTP pyrophosphatase MutT (NUDIX family)
LTDVEQAGGIVFRRDGAGISILLVRAKRDPHDWIFPKGHIEPGESAVDTAVRETAEEAGVDGEAIGSIGGPQEFEYLGKRYRVRYFLIRFVTEIAESEGREKRWFPIDEAIAALQFPGARALLDMARDAIRAIK